jgi:hypothetical protein
MLMRDLFEGLDLAKAHIVSSIPERNAIAMS